MTTLGICKISLKNSSRDAQELKIQPLRYNICDILVCIIGANKGPKKPQMVAVDCQNHEPFCESDCYNHDALYGRRWAAQKISYRCISINHNIIEKQSELQTATKFEWSDICLLIPETKQQKVYVVLNATRDFFLKTIF